MADPNPTPNNNIITCPDFDIPDDQVINDACGTDKTWVQCTPHDNSTYFCTSEPGLYKQTSGSCLPGTYSSMKECLQAPIQNRWCAAVGSGCDGVPYLNLLNNNPVFDKMQNNTL